MRKPNEFAPLWVVDFPLLEWSEEDGRFYAMHHPFTAPKPEHEAWFYSDKKEDLERVCANAYDFVLNGTELGGGSIRIHEAAMQERMGASGLTDFVERPNQSDARSGNTACAQPATRGGLRDTCGQGRRGRGQPKRRKETGFRTF